MNKNTKQARRAGYADSGRLTKTVHGVCVDSTRRQHNDKDRYPGGGPSLHEQAKQLGRAK